MEERLQKFYETFNIEKYHIYRDFKFGKNKVEEGKRELKLAQDKGLECKHISIHKENDEEDMIYWYEYHYPELTDSRLLDLLFLAIQYGFYFNSEITDREKLKFMVVGFLTDLKNPFIEEKVKEIF